MAFHPGRGPDRRRLGRDHRHRDAALPRQHRQRDPAEKRQAAEEAEPLPRRRRRWRRPDLPRHRLRQARQRSRRPGPLGHDDAAPPRPRQGPDLDDVDPARPEGRNPRLRDRQVQRSVFLRRHEADPADGQGADRAADQPRRQRRLPRLRPGASTRSAASTSTSTAATTTPTSAAARTVRRNQRPTRLPADLRQEGARLRALPPYRHRHRPLGPPAGLPRARPARGSRSRTSSSTRAN